MTPRAVSKYGTITRVVRQTRARCLRRPGRRSPREWRALNFTRAAGLRAAASPSTTRSSSCLRQPARRSDRLPRNDAGTGLDSIYVRDASVVCRSRHDPLQHGQAAAAYRAGRAGARPSRRGSSRSPANSAAGPHRRRRRRLARSTGRSSSAAAIARTTRASGSCARFVGRTDRRAHRGPAAALARAPATCSI